MRIKELAGLAGTTPRAIRHYHHEGLLPIPENSGVRNYALDHAVRLLRIRHLTESGLTLSAIRELVHDPEIGLAEAAIDEQIAELEEQRRRLRELPDKPSSDDDPLPYTVPARLALFYEQVGSRLNDEALHFFEEEKRAMEVALRLPYANRLVDDWLENVTPVRLDATVDIYHLFARVPGMEPAAARREFTDHLDRVRSAFGPDWGMRHLNWRGIVRPILMAPGVLTLLTSAYSHPNQKAFIRRFLEEANNVSRETRGVTP